MLMKIHHLKFAAVLFLAILVLLVAGLMIYTIWFAPPRPSPYRSRPVAVSSITDMQALFLDGL